MANILLLEGSKSSGIRKIIQDLGCKLKKVDLGALPKEHTWRRYADPTVLLFDALGAEQVVWGGFHQEAQNPVPELLEARFYTRSNDFRFLLSWLDKSATGVEGVVWLANKITDRQKPKIYLTGAVSDGLDQGTAIAVSPTPEIVFSRMLHMPSFPEVIRFAKINHQALLDHWDYRISSAEAIRRLRRDCER